MGFQFLLKISKTTEQKHHQRLVSNEQEILHHRVRKKNLLT